MNVFYPNHIEWRRTSDWNWLQTREWKMNHIKLSSVFLSTFLIIGLHCMPSAHADAFSKDGVKEWSIAICAFENDRDNKATKSCLDKTKRLEGEKQADEMNSCYQAAKARRKIQSQSGCL